MKITKEKLVALLKASLATLENFEYSPFFFATNARGRMCSPASPDAHALSFRGAIMRASEGNQFTWPTIAWLSENRFIDNLDPVTKDEAIFIFTEAIEQAEKELELSLSEPAAA